MISNPDGYAEGTAQKRYSIGEQDREPYLQRARRCAGLTVPSLFRNLGDDTGSADEINAWQSLGAYLVNNLTSKLTITIFPPGVPFVRLNPSRQALADLQKISDPAARGALKQSIAQGLSASEKEFVDAINEDGDSNHFTVTHKHLIVGGNHGLWMYKDGSIRTIPFTRWVVWRDQQGNPLEWIIKDTLVFATLPADVQDFLEEIGLDPDTGEVNPPMGSSPAAIEAAKSQNRNKKTIDLYTHGCLLDDGKWDVYQETLGKVVPETNWKWDKDYCPFLPIPLDLLPGENYGRSYVEHYEADLQTVDGLTETVTEGTAAAALLIRMVRPGGVTDKKALASARNGAVITGDVKDVTTVETNKGGDWNAAEIRLDKIEMRLKAAFLVSDPRNAERVTAEEIRFTAQELQDSLGGVYSGLVVSEQTPYARLKMAALMREKRMTPLPKNLIKVMIVTGAAALGRNAELAALDALVTVPPGMQPSVPTSISSTMYFQRRATAVGVDQEGLVLTDEEKQAIQAAAAQQQQTMDATAPLIAQGGSLIKGAQDHAAKMAQMQAEQAANQQQQQQGAPQ